MDRVYRISHQGAVQHAVEREGALHRIGGDVFGGYTLSEAIPGGLNAAGLRVLAPVTPSKIVCVGLNYKDHAAESGVTLPDEPLLFFKPPTAVIGPGDRIRLPPGVGRVDHEAELALVIGRRAHRVPRARAWEYVCGLTCLNDVTAREMQHKESQFTRCKGFDTFSPVGPCIVTGLNGEPRNVEAWVNGGRRQASNTRHLIFPIDYLIEYISFVMTLEPGDIVSTGTPEGVGPITAGDTVTVSVEGVGELSNPVMNEQ
ncbi:MAG: fumarylacetoacetate hydrolase family protein [Acidobacteria bacterium]|nr:fumarylacetoacetate hydrolase family protein [Acidobacteriota bacterium]